MIHPQFAFHLSALDNLMEQPLCLVRFGDITIIRNGNYVMPPRVAPTPAIYVEGVGLQNFNLMPQNFDFVGDYHITIRGLALSTKISL